MKRLAKLRSLLRLCAPLIATSLLGGCVTQYVEPPSGPDSVTILFRNQATVSQSTGWHHDQWNHLAVQFYGGSEQCTDRVFVPDEIDPGAEREVRVPAGQELSLTAVSTLYSGREFVPCPGCFGVKFIGCTPTISFVPERGRRYRFDFTVQGMNCPVDVQDVTEGDAPRPVPFTSRRWIRPFGESGPFCEKKGAPGGEVGGGQENPPTP